MDIQDFWVRVANMLINDKYRTWRTGQTYFNALKEIRPDLVEKVIALDIDPYYEDRNIPAFKKFLTENW